MSFTQCVRTALAVRVVVLYGLMVVGLFGLSAERSFATLITLTDQNSVVDFDTESQSNAYNWRVDGVDHLFQQAFWYRVGNVAEQSVHSLPVSFELVSNTNSDPGLDTLNVVYSGAGFNIEITYSLDGGLPLSGASDMGEQISINNTSGSPLDFHFFQYSDFEIQGTAGNDRAVFTNANTVRQYEGALRLSETVATPVPNHREIDFFDNTRVRLTDGVPTTLNDTPIGVVQGPGDMTWAYQWDRTIAANDTFQISKDKNLDAGIIPEPATLAMLICAAGTVLCYPRKR